MQRNQHKREVAIWEAGYTAGLRHGLERRASALGERVANVIDMRAWVIGREREPLRAAES